jgi:hypothetical protein
MNPSFVKRMVPIIIFYCYMVPLAMAQTPMTFDQAITQGQNFANSRPQGQGAANSIINNALSNQSVPGLTPSAQSNAQATGSFFLNNPDQLVPQGQSAMNASTAGQFVGQSYNLRPQIVISPTDPIVTLGESSVSGTGGCITQRVCTQPITQVVTSTQQVACTVDYAEIPAQCTYPLPQPTTVQNNGSGSLCVDHFLYARIYQENSTTYHLQVSDTSPSGSAHWNCGGPGTGGGIGDWHTLDTVTLSAPPSNMNFCVNASGGGCGSSSTTCVSAPNQSVSVITCGAGGAQTPSYTYDYSFQIPALPVSQATIQAACGAYMNPACTQINEQCTSTDCTRSYLCLDTSQVIDGCAPYRSNAGCTLQGSACAITNAYGQCLSQQENYTCTTQTSTPGCAQESVQTICPGAPTGIRCLNDPDTCADTTSVPSADLALAASHLSSLNAIEDDHTVNPVVIFNGNTQSCRRTFASGITRDCCALDTFLLGCNSNEQILQNQRQAGECVQIGTYCSSQINLLFTTVCGEHTTSFCCFSSKLARIIQEQGKPQLGISWGTAQSPDCRGFTPQELQAINFEAIDFSEYYADINPNVPNLSSLSSQVQNSPLLVPNTSNNMPPVTGGISSSQVQQEINQFYQTHAP